MAALEAATLDDRLAGTGSHSRAETVLALAASNIRLIGAFHQKEVQVGGLAVALGYEAVAVASKRPRQRRAVVRLLRRPPGPSDREKLIIPAKERPSAQDGNSGSFLAAALECCRDCFIYSLGGLDLGRQLPRGI